VKQAKVISETEMKRLLNVISASRYAERNRFIVSLSFFGGLRVGEISTLLVGDLFDANGGVKDQIRLKAQNTKANEARAVFVNNKLRKEAEIYLQSLNQPIMPENPLFLTQKRKAFTANTMCQLFTELYSKAGIDGASSHSGRRWFITRMAHSGISAKVIMTLAGHKHLSTTQRYIDVNDEMLKQAVEIL